MAEWIDGNILETEFISHSGPNAYEIHFRTPDRTKYYFVESACREAICRDIHRCSECKHILQLRGHFECIAFDTIFFTDKFVSCEYFSKANADRKAEGGGEDGN